MFRVVQQLQGVVVVEVVVLVVEEEVVDAVGGSACVRDRDQDREVRQRGRHHTPLTSCRVVQNARRASGYTQENAPHWSTIVYVLYIMLFDEIELDIYACNWEMTCLIIHKSYVMHKIYERQFSRLRDEFKLFEKWHSERE